MSIDFIEHYQERWDWKDLSENEALPWSIDLIERYEERWKWNGLSRNKALPWSYRFYERFTERWEINRVAGIYDGNIRKLSREQVTRLLEKL